MELLYNETESGLTTDNRYDGSISAMKWKSIGDTIGVKGLKSYAYSYDKTGRLADADYVKKETSWNKEAGAQDETMTYDHNGNIKTLTRKQRKHQLSGVISSYTNETIDNLTYAYTSTSKNSLEKVTDAASSNAAAGFDNGSSSTSNDYTYDTNGNLLSDKNKGIDSVKYNFLGKPVRMKFSDGKLITYTYDAGGNKLTQKLFNGATLQTTTHYVNGFVYEAAGAGSPALSFFGSPEGRVVNNSGTLSYEYSIADHQGNTRVVFTSATTAANTTTVNFESSTNSDVLNYTRTNFELFDHTDVSGSTYTYSQKLTGASGSQVGIAKTLKVYPGDKVKIDAYAKYYNPSGTSSNITGFALALTTAFGVSLSSTGEALKAYNTLNDYGGIIAGGGSGGSSSYPKLFVNILLFDKDYKFLDAAWEQIDGGEQVGATPKAAHDLMSKEVTVKEAGYAYVFISHENPTLVEFYVDDVVITHTPTNVIQYNEYYPFGLQTSTSWTRDQTKDNNYLYNAANELNKTSGWYEMYYRGYDPAIGRMLQVDPYATMYASSTTYNYALNNPVMMNDPSGGQTDVNDPIQRLPSWGSKRIGYGSGNHWSEGIGYEGWSLDGRSEQFDNMLYGGHLLTGGGGFFAKVNGKNVQTTTHMGKVGYWNDDTGQTGSGYFDAEGFPVMVHHRSEFIEIESEKDSRSWFEKHYRGEAGFEASLGAQATFMIVDGVPVITPYLKGITPGFYLNLGSGVLLQGKAIVNGDLTGKAGITGTLGDHIFNHGAAVSTGFISGEVKLAHGNGELVEASASVTILGGLTMQYDHASKELSVGFEASGRAAVGLGIEGYIKQMLVFKF